MGEPSTGHDGGGSFSSGPPPVAGLGNYKGVMLCNRPPDGPSAEVSKHQPFRSAISDTVGDALGLQRKMPEMPGNQFKSRGPSAALRRHCRWIKELQSQVKEDQVQADEDDRAEHDRKERMGEVFKKQRDAIRLIKQGANADSAELVAILKPKAKKAGGAAQKPAWAMTANEREDFEDVEADDLIDFAENLDFDQYIHDLEFRQQLQVIKDRAKKLQREQDAFKDSLIKEFNEGDDDEEGSEAGSSIAALGGHRRRGGDAGRDERPDWDSSTNAGDDREDAADVKALADRVWQENAAQLKSVHSKNSVKKLIEKAQKEASEHGG
mmetsp:Transcript_61754/g.111100  ORF Transcript_61754/g.111100 Transcript_61754/m.111100 type:complete len:324 (-) Transcript_61754:298-1269(-)